MKISTIEVQRYARHRELFDEQSWERLCKTPIVVAGVGGLGSHVLSSLSRIAPLTIEIWDPAFLDPPDLNRQILYQERHLGRAKVEAASEVLRQINSSLIVHTRQELISLDNFSEKSIVLQQADPDTFDTPFVLFDCLDSFAARMELEKIRKAHRCAVFHGGVERWCGQAATFLPDGKGYVGLFGPDFGTIEKAVKPILPHIVSTIAAFQLGEFLHWCRSPIKTPLSEAMLVFNGLAMESERIELS
jgi:molybdopterin-synthase adenylyltransferase